VGDPDTETERSIGRELDERYRIEAEIGRGGLGRVYRATDKRLEKPVAIKLLHERYGQDQVQRARFEREAKALALLEHPNIVAVTDYGIAGSTPYLVLELLQGETLAQRLARGTLAPERAYELARALLSVLAFAHERGWLHRDIKPANLFLQRAPDGTERLKLLDFGLAKLTHAVPADTDPTLTRTGSVMGTPAYMSPEQIAGDPVDGRSDVYAAGVVLFEVLAGQLPFVGEPADQLRSHMLAPPPTLASTRPERVFRPELEVLLQRALQKLPAQRFADAGAMLSALEAVPQPWVVSNTGTAPALTPSGIAERVRGGASMGAGGRPAQRSSPSTGWFARAVHALFLAGARALAALAMVVIVVALVAIYLAQHRELVRSDLPGLRATLKGDLHGKR
jgi:serine/threonine protein kinase